MYTLVDRMLAIIGATVSTVFLYIVMLLVTFVVAFIYVLRCIILLGIVALAWFIDAVYLLLSYLRH